PRFRSLRKPVSGDRAMSNATLGVPKLCKHRATGRAVVRLSGKDIYLGRFGSAAAKAEYDRKIAEWLANGRQLPDPDGGLSVAELIVAYIRHAATYYANPTVCCRTSHMPRIVWGIMFVLWPLQSAAGAVLRDRRQSGERHKQR